MASIAQFDFDSDLAKNGKWFPIGVDCKLRVARLGNENYTEFLRVNGSDLRPGLILKMGDDKQLTELTLRAMAATVLVGWEGLTDEQNQPVEYSAEKALEYFKKYPEFLNTVVTLANDIDNFRKAAAKEAVKN